jgi:stage II sporulation protein P
MKRLRVLALPMIVILCIVVLWLNGTESIISYIASAVINEIIPSNACSRDLKAVAVSELLPVCKAAYMEDTGNEKGYNSFYADEGYILYGYGDFSVGSSDITSAGSDSDNQTTATDSAVDDTTDTSVSQSDIDFRESADRDAEDDAATDTVDVLAVQNTDGIVSGPTPINYSMTQLSDFETLLSECYVVDSSTTVTEDELDVQNLLGMDMGIDTTGDDIKVLIYHTHGSEAFADSREGVVEDTVIGVGDELTRILEETYGIKVYHDRNIYDNVNGVIDRSNAYNLAGAAIDSILEENPGIEVILDLHRDGVNDEVRLVRTVDGRETAQIMFLNGVSRLKSSGDIEYLYNPHKEENLSFSLKLFLNGRSLYGDLIRKIYIRGYCFNLDRVARSSLIEVGAQTNTVEEAKNAMIPLARILNQVLSE